MLPSSQESTILSCDSRSCTEHFDWLIFPHCEPLRDSNLFLIGYHHEENFHVSKMSSRKQLGKPIPVIFQIVPPPKNKIKLHIHSQYKRLEFYWRQPDNSNDILNISWIFSFVYSLLTVTVSIVDYNMKQGSHVSRRAFIKRAPVTWSSRVIIQTLQFCLS